MILLKPPIRNVLKHVLFLVCMLFSSSSSAQVSQALYDALPTDIRPKNQLSITSSEKRKILIAVNVLENPSLSAELNAMADALKAEAHSTQDWQTKIDNLVSVADYYMSYSNDSAIAVRRRLINYLSDKKEYVKSIAESYLSIASNYNYKEKFDSATDALQIGMGMLIPINDSASIVEGYSIYGAIYSRLGLYSKAVAYGKLALHWSKQAEKWNTGYVQSYFNTVTYYSQLYNETKRTSYIDSAYFIVKDIMQRKKNDSASWFGASYFFLGYLHYVKGDYARAIVFFDLSLLPVFNKASLFLANYDYKYFLYKAICLVKLGQYRAGKQMLEKLTQRPGRYYSWKVAYQAFYEQAALLGNYKDAYIYHTKYKLYADSMDLLGQKGKVFEAEQKYVISKKEEDITRLENENFRQDREKGRIINVVTIVGTVIAIIAMLLSVIYKRKSLYRNAEKLRLSNELLKIEAEMEIAHQRSKLEMEIAILEQRKDISRNLHDELGPGLAALTFYIGDLRKKTKDAYSNALLADVEAEAGNIYKHARAFMHELYNNKVVTQYNVPLFLHNLSTRFGKDSAMEILTQFNEAEVNLRFTPQQHTELYFVIREAVANSMKYSGATQLWIRLNITPTLLTFEIVDNGQGLDETKLHEGLGLQSLKARMDVLNGILQIQSTTKGILMTGSFPL